MSCLTGLDVVEANRTEAVGPLDVMEQPVKQKRKKTGAELQADS